MHRFVGLCACALLSIEAAKILAVIPTPSISHQTPFRPFTQELARRGHEVTIITADPAFEKGKAPPRIREIDVHDYSYKIWNEELLPTSSKGQKEDLMIQVRVVLTISLEYFIELLKNPEIESIIKNETFDLLLLEDWARPVLIFTHFFPNIPAISISSLGGCLENYEIFGAATHPLLYPKCSSQKINERTWWDKIVEVYNYWHILRILDSRKDIEITELRKFAPDMPDYPELLKRLDMMFLNIHPVFDGNRPVPPSVIFVSLLNEKKPKPLPEDLETYLNTSRNGVVYVSFGTNVKPSTLPAEKVQAMIKVFSQLPYDVLWRWDQDHLPGKTDNMKIFKWLPQSDLLYHPAIKVFMTQCGLQSSDEAIEAGVPLLGVPMLGDQWHNSERYVQLGIGKAILMSDLDEHNLKEGLEDILRNNSYRTNIAKLRSMMRDQPQSGLERAVWWTEYLLRHGSGKHLRASGAGITWREYLELDLVCGVLAVLVGGLLTVMGGLWIVWKKVTGLVKVVKAKQS